MIKKRFLAGILAIALVSALTITSCDDNDDSGNPALTGTVSITGTAMVGQTLTANTANLGGIGTFSYQWKRDVTTNIGTNSSTYLVQAVDVGSTITVTVTCSGNTGSVTSSATDAVEDVPFLSGTVSITGTAKVGQTLTANTDSLGGSGAISYQWKRGDTTSAITETIGSDSENYLLTEDDLGKFITVTVTRTGYSGDVTSAPTAAVADIMSWTPINHTTIFGTTNGNGVAWNGTDQWVAVGSGGTLAYSANGENWFSVNLSSTGSPGIFVNNGINQSINAVAYGNGKWIAVGGWGKAATSTNGTTWTAIENNPFGTQNVYSVAYANNRWIAGGMNGVMRTSTDDGVTWTNVTHPFGYNSINSIAYGNNRWIAAGAAGKMATSTDGQTWTDVDVASIFTYSYGGSSAVQTIDTVAYADNQWVAAGGGGIMATSTNGTTWTAVTGAPFGTATIQAVAYGNNRWVAVGGSLSGRIAVSSDGSNWTSVADTSFGNSVIKGIAFGNNKWVAVGDNSRIAYAIDN